MHIAKSDKKVKFYNLDVIISVGYRVNSKKGTEFRIWATNVLKQHLIQGYTFNEKKLKEQTRKFQELQKTVKLLENVVKNKELSLGEAEGLLKIITEYNYALDILDQYDHQKLEIEGTSAKEIFKITYKEAVKAIKKLKEKLGGSELLAVKKMNHSRVL